MWTQANWCQFNQETRTNNGVKGYHNKLKQNCKQANAEFSTLVKELHKEAVFIHTTTVHVFCEQTTRKRKPAQLVRQEKLDSLWEKLIKKDIDAFRVVEKAANLNTPKITGQLKTQGQT